MRYAEGRTSDAPLGTFFRRTAVLQAIRQSERHPVGCAAIARCTAAWSASHTRARKHLQDGGWSVVQRVSMNQEQALTLDWRASTLAHSSVGKLLRDCSRLPT